MCLSNCARRSLQVPLCMRNSQIRLSRLKTILMRISWLRVRLWPNWWTIWLLRVSLLRLILTVHSKLSIISMNWMTALLQLKLSLCRLWRRLLLLLVMVPAWISQTWLLIAASLRQKRFWMPRERKYQALRLLKVGMVIFIATVQIRKVPCLLLNSATSSLRPTLARLWQIWRTVTIRLNWMQVSVLRAISIASIMLLWHLLMIPRPMFLLFVTTWLPARKRHGPVQLLTSQFMLVMLTVLPVYQL